MRFCLPGKCFFKYLLAGFFALLLFINTTHAQYSAKLEAGYWVYQSRMIRVEPGPNWKGYYLAGKPDGADAGIINGISFADRRLFTGVGVGYINFAGTKGYLLFADAEYLPLRTRLTPLANLKIGRSHIWNQYNGGTATTFLEATAGMNCKLTKRTGAYLKSGVAFTQQSMFIPVRLGMRL